MSKSKHISVTYDNNGDVVSIGKVKVVDESRAAELQEQANITQDKMDREKQQLVDKIKALNNHISVLYRLISHLLGNKELTEKEIESYLEELSVYEQEN